MIDMQQIKEVRDIAIRENRMLLLVPMFEGEPIIYNYCKEGDKLVLQNRPKSAIQTLPTRWGGEDVRNLQVFGKLIECPRPAPRKGGPDMIKRLHAIAVKVNGEIGFNSKHNMLVNMNLLEQAGFKTAIGLAHVFGPHVQAAEVRDYVAAVKEAISEGRSSLWAVDKDRTYPEPANVRAFLLG